MQCHLFELLHGDVRVTFAIAARLEEHRRPEQRRHQLFVHDDGTYSQTRRARLGQRSEMSPERQRPYSPGVTEAVAADSPLFQGVGSMTYPEANMERMRDGIGMAGPGAYCIVTRGEIQIGPTEFFKRLQKPMPVRWPDLVLPVNEVRCAEELLFGRYRFRLHSVELDGGVLSAS